MNTDAIINISIQSFGCLISLMIILFLKAFKKKCTHLDNLYITMLFCNALLQFSNILSWLSDNRIDQISFYVSRIANFSMFVLSYVLIATFTRYLAAFVENRNGKVKGMMKIITFFVIVSFILCSLNGFIPIFYYFNETNRYIRGDYYWLSNVLAIVMLIPSIYILVKNHRLLQRNELFGFSAYLVLPIVAVLTLMTRYGALSIHLITTFVAISMYVFIQAEEGRAMQENELALEKSKTAMMVSQIGPHFLYNSLTSIKQLCDNDPKKASEALEHFSYYLRGNLDSLANTKPISFEKEMNHVQNYLYLEKIRFENRISVNFEIEEKEFYIPALSLQLLVENAIRHGIMKRAEGGKINIHTKKVNNNIEIKITDNGVGFDPNQPMESSRSHIGLQNVKYRIENQCSGTLQIESHINRGTTVTITLPIH